MLAYAYSMGKRLASLISILVVIGWCLAGYDAARENSKSNEIDLFDHFQISLGKLKASLVEWERLQLLTVRGQFLIDVKQMRASVWICLDAATVKLLGFDITLVGWCGVLEVGIGYINLERSTTVLNYKVFSEKLEVDLWKIMDIGLF